MRIPLDGLVRADYHQRQRLDQRKRCDRYTYSYRLDGTEWRIAIEVQPGEPAPWPQPYIERDFRAA